MVLLRTLVHPQYLLRSILDAAAERFAAGKSIQLQQFLLPNIAAKASRIGQLKEHYVPDQYRCREPNGIPVALRTLQNWLKSREAAALISFIIKKKVSFKESCICSYQHRDYTVRHDKNRELPGYDVLLDLTPSWNARACGHHSYVKNGEEIVRIPAMFNSLAIIHRPNNVQKFVKYVNHHAGKDKRIVLEARFA